ncbi:MAG: mechanosensitive ion channel [Cyanobacteriota/Melainabacteria group bacterium]
MLSKKKTLLIFIFFIGFGLIGLVNPVPAQEPLLPPEKKAVSTEIPGLVSVQSKELFTIQARLGPFKKESRAKNVIKRLERLLEDPDFKPDAITIAENDTTVDVIAGDTVITTVTQDDAKLASLDTGVELSRKELAERYADKLKEVLPELKTKQTVTETLEDMSVKNFSREAQQLLLEPFSLKLGIVALGAVIILGIAAMVRKSLGRYIKDSINRYNARKIVTFFAYLLCLLFATVVFRDALGNLAFILGAAAAGIAFALKEVIISIAGWVVVTFGNFYKVGDRVEIGKLKGDVIDIGLGRTTLMELGEWVQGDLYTGRIVGVDNSAIFSGPIFNYSRDFPFLWDEIIIPVKYGSDYDFACALLEKAGEDLCSDYSKEAASHWEHITRKYLVENAQTNPMVTYIFNDNWVEFTLRYVVDYKKRRFTRFEISKRILADFEANENKVGLASATFHLVQAPVLDVRVSQGSAT